MKHRNLSQVSPRLLSLISLLCLLCALLLCSCGRTAEQPAAVSVTDRAGNGIVLPQQAESIVSLAPSITQVLLDLGMEQALVGVDSYSALYWPQLAALPQFDMQAPDAEALAALEPDIILVSGMSFVESKDPLAAVKQLGICVADVPSSSSLADIRDDVLFIADCVARHSAGEELIAQFDAELADIAVVAATVAERKTVVLEISALPYLYSCGSGTYQDEMLTLIGADNVFGSESGWLAVSEELEVAADPDVILTCVDYLDDPVGEILSRDGWSAMQAVSSGEVYCIDNLSLNLPNHHIVKALRQMAAAVYPDYFPVAGE